MKLFVAALVACSLLAGDVPPAHGQADSATYLSGIKAALRQQWPRNRTINLVFHGHSVPTGYANTPNVHRLRSYPFLLLKALQQKYPYSVVNIITTSIGGENAEQGAKRFESDVLIHRPDVVFIDYALNDRRIGLVRARAATGQMIRQALKAHVKVVLLTPSPDLQVDITQPDNQLAQLTAMLKELAEHYQVGLADSFGAFVRLASSGVDLHAYMAQSNHPNQKGHEVIVRQIMPWF